MEVKRHGHVAPFLKSCRKCVQLRKSREQRVRNALLKQRARTAIRRKGKPRFKAGKDPAKLAWIRQYRCVIHSPMCDGAVEAAHVRSRGAGGTDGEVIPLCRWHHERQHRIGIRSFWNEYCIVLDLRTLPQVAAAYQHQYEKAVALGWTPEDA